MFSLWIECSPAEKDRIVAELWEQGTVGIVEHDLAGGACRLQAFFAEPVSTRYGDDWHVEEERDWNAIARSCWQPFTVGSRFFLAPSWRDDPTPAGRFRIEIDPGMAFGTGLHATTQLCMEALEEHLRPGASVLDVGTGSGILAIAAALLGAGRVWACDVDAEAVEITRRNVQRAGMPVALFVGSTACVRARSADVVVANINAATLTCLAADIAAARTEVAILSGFVIAEAGALMAALGIPVREVREKNDWVCFIC